MNGSGFATIDKPWLKYYRDESINYKLPDSSIFDYLLLQSKNRMENVALNYYGSMITYHEMFEKIDSVAKAFYALGVRKNDIVVMTTVTIPETIYAFYALNRIGAIPNMVDPRTSREGIRDYIKETDSHFILSIDAAYEKVKTAIPEAWECKVITISPADSFSRVKKGIYQACHKTRKIDTCDLDWGSFVTAGEDTIPLFPPLQKDGCCVIVHTGGTTGFPKGVMLSNESINSAVVQCSISNFDLCQGDVWLSVMPPFIAYGITNGIHMPLCTGATIVLLPDFAPEKFDRYIMKYQPNHIAGVPSHYFSLIHSSKLKNADLSCLKSPTVGGDGIDSSFETEVSAFLHNRHCQAGLVKGYGMTETSAAICASPISQYNKIGSVGIPFTHSVIGIFDIETGKELPYNVTGEVCIHTPTMMLGYYNKEKETQEIIHIHDDGLKWIHSGDIGYMDEDGCLFIVGRSKRMIIRHDGFKLFPSLIENTVAGYAPVKNCCVVGVRDKAYNQGKLPIVFVVLDPSYDISSDRAREELFALCKKELPEYEQPIDFIFRSKLPYTNVGKVDYRLLEDEAQNM